VNYLLIPSRHAIGISSQGLGWLCIEELVWGDKQHVWVPPGHLFTKGPGTYKIPSVNDIPIDFRVSLLQNAPNPRAVHSSKVRPAADAIYSGMKFSKHAPGLN
jgi:xanthine dehydrogenase molybdopterin-binding subunit B